LHRTQIGAARPALAGRAPGQHGSWTHAPIGFSAKWKHDFDAHDTFEGDVVALSLTVGLCSGRWTLVQLQRFW